MTTKTVAVIIVVLIQAFIPARCLPDEVSGRTYITNTLVNLDEYDVYSRSLRVSPDSRNVAVAVHDGENSFVAVNGGEGPRYKYVAEMSISFVFHG